MRAHNQEVTSSAGRNAKEEEGWALTEAPKVADSVELLAPKLEV